MMNRIIALWLLLSVSKSADTSSSQSSTTIITVQPLLGPACPGEDVILRCRVQTMPQPMSVPPTMYWQQTGSKIIDYYNGVPLSAKFGDFHTTAHFSNNNYTIISNATLSHVKLLHNGITVKCYSPLSTSSKIITVAGADISPTNITLSNINNTFAVLSWIPPLNESYCSFNYTVNITNSSSVTEQMYSNSTSLILTNLTHGENYSFAVAVTDSMGQHGPWSEELMVTWDDNDVITASSPPDSIFYLKTTSSPSASLNIERAAFEDVYQLVIGLTGGALLVCISFLIFAICSFTIWCIRRKHTSFICDGRKDPSAVDMVVYDVPVFATNSVSANKENALQINSMICGDTIINQNIAYGQVCKKT